jgi:hypothetical protein
LLDVREEVPVLDALPLRQERRRAGRMANVSRALIPLLRDEGQPTCDDEVLRDHDLAPATGIAVGVVLSGLIWFTIGCILLFG